jgi:hypothetical protein
MLTNSFIGALADEPDRQIQASFVSFPLEEIVDAMGFCVE